jgi:hypothetical protein
VQPVCHRAALFVYMALWRKFMPDAPWDRNLKLWAQKVGIFGGAIDGATIGATTPSTGAFTTLSATGATTFSGAETHSGAVTVNSTGSLIVSSATINFTNVTSVDPSVAGQLYQNSTGQVFISAG